MDPIVARVAARFMTAKTSPAVFKYLDGVYAKNKARYDEEARESVDEDDVRALVRKHPSASDEELVAIALKKLSLSI
jgi:hypothetical protein